MGTATTVGFAINHEAQSDHADAAVGGRVGTVLDPATGGLVPVLAIGAEVTAFGSGPQWFSGG